MNENSQEPNSESPFSSHQEVGSEPHGPASSFRKRRQKGDRHDRGERPRLSKLMGRNRRGGRLSNHQRGERIMVIASFLLSIVVVGFLAFLGGQRVERSRLKAEVKPEVEEVLPTPEEDAQLDKAFGELSGGNFHKALLDFQKIHDDQPALSGIDYLVGSTALRVGEEALAEEALQRSIDNKEMEGESRVLLAILGLRKATTGGDSHQLADPVEAAESAFKKFAATRPGDAKIYAQWAEVLRARGSFRRAEDLLHKGILRADPTSSESVLSGKENLTRLQDMPSQEVPSLSEITSMSGDQALGAALTALQHQKKKEALLFLERASDSYPPQVFRELMEDCAFDHFRTDPDMKKFLKNARPSEPAADVGSQ